MSEPRKGLSWFERAVFLLLGVAAAIAIWGGVLGGLGR